MVKGVYGRECYLQKVGRLKKYKESSNEIWGEDEYRSKKTSWIGQKKEILEERIYPENTQQRCYTCYELKLLGLNNRTTLVLSNTRELDRDLSTN